MLNLPNVTLIVLTSVHIASNVSAMKKSCAGIKYGSVKFISDIMPDNLPEYAKYESCPKLTYEGFSEYTFLHLHTHIETEFALLVHHDGFVINPDLWTDEFLEYDYIGAPWAYTPSVFTTSYGEVVEVGNAGVCIRSKKLLTLPTQLNLSLIYQNGSCADDVNYCVHYRNTFLENGMKYAPKELAAKFSTETWIPGISTESFAFHGICGPEEKMRFVSPHL